jgi:hypothetical protein
VLQRLNRQPAFSGRLAQLGERLVYTQKVVSSSLAPPSKTLQDREIEAAFLKAAFLNVQNNLDCRWIVDKLKWGGVVSQVLPDCSSYGNETGGYYETVLFYIRCPDLGFVYFGSPVD